MYSYDKIPNLPTYQDFLITNDKDKFILNAINVYINSNFYKYGIDAEEYYKGNNTKILQRNKYMQGRFGKVIETNVNKVTTNFFQLFTTQVIQRLLSNGVRFSEKDLNKKLGEDFNATFSEISEFSQIHGVSWGYWNNDRIKMFKATDFFALQDELSSDYIIGIRFWKVSQEKQMFIELYEYDGVTMYTTQNNTENKLTIIKAKTPYKQKVKIDILGEQLLDTENYSRLPIFPLFSNAFKTSELTVSMKSKIDLIDRIFSDFGDNLDRTNDIYWVIKNFGGENVSELLEEIHKFKAIQLDDPNTDATPHTIEVPWQARKTALEILEKRLYADAMALNMEEIKGGSLTNVAINTAEQNLDMKCDRVEWQLIKFIRQLLNLLGYENIDINFDRRSIKNDAEMLQNIYLCGADLTHKKRLELNPLIDANEIDQILKEFDLEVNGLNEQASTNNNTPVDNVDNVDNYVSQVKPIDNIKGTGK